MRSFFKLFGESFLFAINGLVVNRLRTFLSLLGITVGIFAIISVFTMVDTMEYSIRNSVESLGNDVIYVQKWPWGAAGSDEYEWWEYLKRPEPDLEEFEQLRPRINTAREVAFLSSTNQTVEYMNSSIGGVSIMAVTHGYAEVRPFDLLSGRYFTPSETKSGRNLAVIGASVAKNLFYKDDPVGSSIKIAGRKVDVVGVIKKEGESLIGNSMDNAAIIPVIFARSLFDIQKTNTSILARARDQVENATLKDEITGAMRSIRRLRPKEENNFALNEPSLLSSSLEDLFDVINIVGLVIGGFSILVGGFSIANIMFVSVRERTPMIGIQKSLGARNYFILLQFLFESMILCLIGGLIGLLLVFLGTVIVSTLLNVNALLSVTNILRGVGISALIGILSGFIPAWLASRLDPVEAIRTTG